MTSGFVANIRLIRICYFVFMVLLWNVCLFVWLIQTEFNLDWNNLKNILIWCIVFFSTIFFHNPIEFYSHTQKLILLCDDCVMLEPLYSDKWQMEVTNKKNKKTKTTNVCIHVCMCQWVCFRAVIVWRSYIRKCVYLWGKRNKYTHVRTLF